MKDEKLIQNVNIEVNDTRNIVPPTEEESLDFISNEDDGLEYEFEDEDECSDEDYIKSEMLKFKELHEKRKRNNTGKLHNTESETSV